MTYSDRIAAGRRLAEVLAQHRGDAHGRPLVLGLPRGGVPVAAQVAAALDGDLDVLVVRKVGVPWQPELAMGAVAEGGVRVVDQAVISRAGIDPGELVRRQALAEAELDARGRAWRSDRPRLDLADREVIIVDDGMATGQTALAAYRCVAAAGAASLTVAVPVASVSAVRLLEDEGVSVVCPLVPSSFAAVGQWYRRFDQTADDEVVALLADAGAH